MSRWPFRRSTRRPRAAPGGESRHAAAARALVAARPGAEEQVPPRDPDLLAEFASADALVHAVEQLRAAGADRLETFTPFPIADLTEQVEHGSRVLPLVALGAGLVGGALMYLMQYWMHVHAYPIVVAARPLHSWPPFATVSIIAAIVWAALAALLAMLAINRLPRLNHPLFDVPGFERATDDRFFLLARATAHGYQPPWVRTLLERCRPLRVREVWEW